MAKSVFEHVTCSRCLGTGQYSYNQIDGSRCYGCQGTGNKYTKRGAVARAWWKAQTEMVASEVTVGMRIETMGNTFTVEAVETYEQRFARDGGPWQSEIWLNIAGQGLAVCVPPTHKVVRRLKGAEAQELLQRAKAYQDTLTKAGTVRRGA